MAGGTARKRSVLCVLRLINVLLERKANSQQHQAAYPRQDRHDGEEIMGCTNFSGPGFVGHICHGDNWLSLEPFGAKVWVDDHNWLGPTFYRSESALKVIDKPSKKTWEAYCKWRATLNTNLDSSENV